MSLRERIRGTRIPEPPPRPSLTRCDQYRDLLETWAEWWNNVGRYHFTHYITPPITATGEALGCAICAGITSPDEDRCAACGRKISDV